MNERTDTNLRDSLRLVSAVDLQKTVQDLNSGGPTNVKDMKKFRLLYPAYDEVCKLIESLGSKGLSIQDEAVVRASGMEIIFRALITLAEFKATPLDEAPQ